MAVQSQSTHVWYNKTTVTASHFIYNSTKYVSATTGWINAKYDHVNVQCRLASKANANTVGFIYRVEGKFDQLDRPASIYCNKITAVQPIDQLITVTPKVKQIRLAVKTSRTVASVTASPCTFYGGVCFTEVK